MKKETESDEAYIKRKMKEVNGGEFVKWYNNLPGYLQEMYKREFQKLQDKYEK
tara:strand:- start:1269 stop:1427 length:159 start_codon:yes stop_codon:yes gene_type:complete